MDRVSDELRETGRKWAEAERGGDIVKLDELLSDDFTAVGPVGFILTKQQWLGRYQSGDLVNKEFGWEPALIRDYGMTALVIGTQTQNTTYKGQPIEGGQFRLTQVLTNQHGQWRLASIHISNLAPGAK